ncbi:MAG: glutamine synthetase [Bacteroidales bacterium]|nr:glutamine synthetase [Bacteroidales bacterium]
MNPTIVLDEIKSLGSQKIKIAFADIDGILRGKIINKEKFLEIAEKGIGFCNVIFGWDSSDSCYDNVEITGLHTGYPDIPGFIDLSTFRKVPWDNNMPFFLGDFSGNNTDGLASCPRTLLKKIERQCSQMGFTPYFSQEFEWFNFNERPGTPEMKKFQLLEPISPGMFGYSILRPTLYKDYFNDLFDLTEAFDIPLEGLHTETGPGVYEAAIKYDTVLKASDKATLFKTAVKEIAYRHNIMASFMAKWNKDLPGCSGHIHQSLWDSKAKQNLFYDKNDKKNMSNLLKNYIAGQLYCLPHILPMYAPTVNSYKRLAGGAWAPATLTWGIENRTTALRVINSTEANARLETRVPGSDTNPYLAMAASLASGLYGIQNNLSLSEAPTEGNGYVEKKSGALAGNLLDATIQMKNSAIARELFGNAFVDHFTTTREWEWRQFSKHVSDWELQRYFEII